MASLGIISGLQPQDCPNAVHVVPDTDKGRECCEDKTWSHRKQLRQSNLSIKKKSWWKINKQFNIIF